MIFIDILHYYTLW